MSATVIEYSDGIYTAVKDGARTTLTPQTRSFVLVAGSSANIIAGVSGQCLCILMVVLGSGTATASYAACLSATIPTGLITFNAAPNTVASAIYQNDTGLMTCLVGEALRVDVGAAAAVYVAFKYFYYIP